MQIREVIIRNFRGISSLKWRPGSRMVCILGPGDTGKSTILDAIEAALAPRWISFSDVDFPGCDTTKTIEVLITIGELPQEALKEGKMGMFLRGWSPTGELPQDQGEDDEPKHEQEGVVTVRLTVDANLDPTWDLFTTRQDPKPLSLRDRALFGMVRLGGDPERHLTWAQGSALARLTTDKDHASTVLAEAHRKARGLVNTGEIVGLDSITQEVTKAAKSLGAYMVQDYSKGLDTQRAAMSLGGLALHDGDVPVRLAGLGTRRLAALAIQRLAIPGGAIVLIDEMEQGLEPHRIRHALKVLRESLNAPPDQGGAGQVIMTTHATTCLVELSVSQLAIARTADGFTLIQPPGEQLQALVRSQPEAFLGRKIVVCEGKTEIGLLRELRTYWRQRHKDEPIELHGVVLADGGGSEAPARAMEFARLGYRVTLLRDSDVMLSEEETEGLKKAGVLVNEWPDVCSTEQRICRDLSDVGIQKVLNAAYELFSPQSILDQIQTALSAPSTLPPSFMEWHVSGKTRNDYREAIACAAKRKGWFKNISLGELMGQIVAQEMEGDLEGPLPTVLKAIEAWIYA